MCFVWIWEQIAIISLYSINWLVCITETECVYCAVRTELLTLTNSTFCPHSVFMCFVWIWEQTAIISLYSINLFGFYNRGRECLLRGTEWVFKSDRNGFVREGSTNWTVSDTKGYYQSANLYTLKTSCFIDFVVSLQLVVALEETRTQAKAADGHNYSNDV